MAARDRGKSQLSLILDGYNFKNYINTIEREELLKGIAPDGYDIEIRQKKLGEISDSLFSLSNNPVYTVDFISENKFGSVRGIGKHLQVTFEDSRKYSGPRRFFYITARDPSPTSTNDAPLINIEKSSFNTTFRNLLNPGSLSRITALGYNLQGFVEGDVGNDFSDKVFSIKKMLKLPEESQINKNVNEIPTKNSPHLSTYQIFDESLAIGNRQTSELAAFFNLIPTVEFSRAVPVIAAKFSLPAKIFKGRGNNRQEFSVANNADFLYGSESDASKSTMDVYRGDSFTKIMQGRDKQSATKFGIHTNLDIFLSPQTMVNTEEDSTITRDTQRINPVIDKMRPFMSIESFDIDVKPTRGLLSYKTAQLNLILHDRSRMIDIAPFIKPDLFGSFGSEISIEYGWAHPDGSNPFGAILNLMRAREKYMIVNSNFNLQQTGEVKISLSLAMLGATDIINTDIFSANDLQNALRSFNEEMERFKREVSNFSAQSSGDQNSAQNLREVSGRSIEAANVIVTQPGAGDQLLKKINEFIVNPSIRDDVGDRLQENATKLRDVLQNLRSQKNDIFDSFKAIIDSKYDPYLSYETLRKMSIINNEGVIIDEVVKEKSISSYISFGKLVMALVGKDLAESNRFNEIQFIFYNTNNKCSKASSVNIANLPIRKVKLKNFLKNVIQETVTSLSIGGLLLALSKRFLSNKATVLFGFDGLFEYDSKTGSTRVARNISQSKSENSQNQILYKHYYGEEEYNLMIDALNKPEAELSAEERRALVRKVDFVAPKIGFSTEVIYKNDNVDNRSLNVSPEPAFSFSSSNRDEHTILRVHVFDKSNTPFQGAYDFITAVINNDIGQLQNNLIVNARKDLVGTNSGDRLTAFNQHLSENLNSLIVEARNGTENQVEINVATRFGKVKETYKKIMPTLTYGTQNSAILNASFQTINEGRLSTVFITRSDRELETRQDDESNAIKIGSKDLPLRVLPSKVDLTTFGCPVINFAQSLFFDFGTGTTIDNLYNVTGIKHSISQGKFESGLTLQYGDIYGKFESRIVTVDSLSSIMEQIQTNRRTAIEREEANRRAVNRSRRAGREARRPPGSPNFLLTNLFKI